MHAYHRMEADQTDSIAVCATKEEWRGVLDKLKYIPAPAIRDDSFSDLVHWLINQGVYE